MNVADRIINFAKKKPVMEIPNLVMEQKRSYEKFLQRDVPSFEKKATGLQRLFLEMFPVEDIYGKYRLEFISYSLGEPIYSMEECKKWGLTYATPIRVKFRLEKLEGNKDDVRIREAIEEEAYLGDIPLLTPYGGFIINGAERVVVTQLHRSPGVFFDENVHPNGTHLFSARIIPDRGSWIELAFDIRDTIFIHFSSRRKISLATLLRALGYSTQDMLRIFYTVEDLPLKDFENEPLTLFIAEDIIDTETGEIFADTGKILTPEIAKMLQERGIESIKVVKLDTGKVPPIIINCINADPTSSQDDAIRELVAAIRPNDVLEDSQLETALDDYLFNPDRFYLAAVGRFKINQRLKMDIPLDHYALTPDDFITIAKHLIMLYQGQEKTDDIDHLGLRRVKTVGELVEQQMRIALARMNRTIQERMRVREETDITPQKLVNARTVMAVVNSFFGSSQLSQFMDQTNPLAEITHKRRLSALGPGGLTRERAGFEVRDVHYTHYGRMCPIETPEGQNIGLITSLASYARINDLGFLETPYRKVKNGIASKEIEYLSADEEDLCVIAQASVELDENGKILDERVLARKKGNIVMVSPAEITHMDIAPQQMVSIAAALIPFLEHDDANRALMGSNMQRQSVPLLFPERPIVGTGLEDVTARDSGAVVRAKRAGIVQYVDARRILIKPNIEEQHEILELQDVDEYIIRKFERSNQNTAINQRPLVVEGQKVERGQVIADGPSTYKGELALGKNLLAAFMPWYGYNYEDAIILNERLVKDDTFTSVHIETFDVEVRETKLGPEELTRELPNVSESAVRNLDENGIIRLGAKVSSGDILVGKVTPKGEKELTPEERLLRAIFGEKAGDVKNTSLKAPPGMNGIVINTVRLSRKEFTPQARKDEREKIKEIEHKFQLLTRKILRKRNARLTELLKGKTASEIVDKENGRVLIPAGEELTGVRLRRLSYNKIDISREITPDTKTNEMVRDIFQKADELIARYQRRADAEKAKFARENQLKPGVIEKIKVDIAMKRKVQVGDKMAGRHGNKGVISTIVPEEDMPFLSDGTPVDIVLNPLGVPSRMNIGQLLETNLGWALERLGYRCYTPVFNGATVEEIKDYMEKAKLSSTGKEILYNGRTGDKFAQPVVVGKIYMMKLVHLAEDKLHARSIGPYSLVTQQPLGGKAQFGGQRFGEMEVWALEAYGAAYTLQEMLTVKSDDVAGRSKIYQAIVKGENPPEPGIPESFNVLLQELHSLCLDVQLITNDETETE